MDVSKVIVCSAISSLIIIDICYFADRTVIVNSYLVMLENFMKDILILYTLESG